MSRLEAQLTGLAEDVDNVLGLVQAQSQTIGKMQESTGAALRELSAETSENIRRQGSDLASAIQSLASKHEAAQRPQWATYASWAAVMLAFGGIFGTIVMSAIGEDRAGIHALEVRDLQSERERGVLTERSRWLEKLLDEEREPRDG